MKRILQIDNALRLVPYYKVNHCEEAFALVSGCELGSPRRWCEETLQSSVLGSYVFLFGSAW